ncbi:uncharacterized protein LOC126248189 [Schistocerca nitens]|uniref:uncharacterized protein LOC126248189 n=1 Tax=Schistocerca nitens TaxID=7011 RepID=UPI0021197BD6|nr:uncharacterized protein LOC126248189 [Schistocerca nitens]
MVKGWSTVSEQRRKVSRPVSRSARPDWSAAAGSGRAGRGLWRGRAFDCSGSEKKRRYHRHPEEAVTPLETLRPDNGQQGHGEPTNKPFIVMRQGRSSCSRPYNELPQRKRLDMETAGRPSWTHLILVRATPRMGGLETTEF